MNNSELKQWKEWIDSFDIRESLKSLYEAYVIYDYFPRIEIPDIRKVVDKEIK